MGQLAYGVVGAAIGFYFGGPTGAQVGWAVGTGVGAAVDPAKGQDGPRLEDRSVQVSTYGQPIPRIYGTYRTSGNVIWATDIQETEHEEGGKGGGPVYSTFSYSVSFAVGICAGPIVGIRKIWADGNLIYDVSQANTGHTRSFEATDFVFYLGTETQEPDPTIQIDKGDTPAYRGLVYAVFTDFQLAKFGNRIPSLSFEVVQSGDVQLRPAELIVPTPFGSGGHSYAVIDTDTGYVWATDDSDTRDIVVYDPITREVIETIDTGISQGNEPNIRYCQLTRTMWVTSSAVLNNNLIVYSADSFTVLHSTTVGSYGVTGYDESSQSMIFGSTYGLNDTLRYYDVLDYSLKTTIADMYTFTWLSVSIPGYDQIYTSGNTSYSITSSFSEQLVKKESLTGFAGNDYTNEFISLDTRRDLIYQADPTDTVLFVYDPRTLTGTYETITGMSGNIKSVHYHAPTDTILVMNSTSRMYQVYPDTYEVYREIPLPAEVETGMAGFVDVPTYDDRVYGTSDDGLCIIYLGDMVLPDTISLATVVTAESDLCGLEASDIDVTDLVPVEVTGFMIGSGAIRSGIEQLMTAYQFDCVESGGVVKFVLLGGSAVATLSDDDLAAHQPGNDVPSPLPLQRAEEIDLPRSVTIRYSNPDADYQTGTQIAQRLTGRALGDQGSDLPLVLSDAQAAQIAEAVLYASWAARMSTSFVTTLKWSALEPTDVVNVGGNEVYVTRRTENYGLITFDAVFYSGAIFTQVTQGVAANIPTQTLPDLSKTAIEFLDIPMLRDQDNNSSFYVAATGYRTGWPGALLYKSTASGGPYAELLAITNASVMGVAMDVLGDFFTGNVFDELNTVTVWIRSGGTLSSTTELAVLNGGNPALLGDEILQFKTATLNADGSYTLSGLLRGRQGTATSGHAAGDRFVFLSANALERPAAVDSEINLARFYKAVTFGAIFNTATEHSFTNTAQALMPLAPVQLGAGRNTALDVTFTWIRRTRYGGAWRDYADVIVGEDSESYELDVYTNGTYTTVVRTLTSSTVSVGYTAAQQTTDFGSAQATLYVRVYQLSAAVGRGGYLQGAV